MKAVGKFFLILCLFLQVNILYSQGFTSLNSIDHPNGPIKAMAIDTSRNLLFIGGDFSYVGPDVPYGALIQNNGEPDLSFPMPNNKVNVVEPDGNGGWYIGGEFTYVGDSARNKIAHINSAGQVTEWNANISPSYSSGDDISKVESILISDNSVYIGGYFFQVGDSLRNYLAEVNKFSGEVSSWNPNPNSNVTVICDGDTVVFIGGYFTTIANTSKERIAVINKFSGLTNNWNLNVPSGLVRSFLLKDSTLFVGGYFNSIGGFPRNCLASVNICTGQVLGWNPNIQISGGNGVYCMDSNDSLLIVGGYFTTVGGINRNSIVSFSTQSGNLTNWNPNINSLVKAVAIRDTIVIIGGVFSSIGSSSVSKLSAINISDGLVNQLLIGGADNNVNSISLQNNYIYVGGEFTSICGVSRNNIASIDISNGKATAWKSDANDEVWTICIQDSSILCGGIFTSINGVSRNRIAKVSISNGSVESWNPNANSFVRTIVIDNNRIYVGGNFTTISGQTRYRLASFDLSTGILNSWNPAIDNQVTSLQSYSFIGIISVHDNSIYVGGSFTKIGSLARLNLGEIDKTSGIATSWNPGVQPQNDIITTDYWVSTILIENNSIYIGGSFTGIGYSGGIQTRNNLAEIDRITGIATSWDLNPNNMIGSICRFNDSCMFIGGYYTNIGNVSRNRLSLVNRINGNMISWSPNIDASVDRLLYYDSTIFVGGSFNNVNDNLHRKLAFFKECELPFTALAINGDTFICQGQNSITYSVPTIANATSYVWSLPTGVTGTSTTNSITVDYGAYATSGNITVKGNNSCGDGAISTLAITVNPLPVAAGTITGNTTVCQGQNSVTYTLPTITNSTSYVWTLPSGATGTSTTNIITADFGTSAISGDITVKGTNSCGDGTASTLPITVNIKPTTPIITLNGLVLQSDALVGNQWFNQNGLINGATNQNHTVTVDGDYYVIVSLSGCSSDPSNSISVTVTDIEVVEKGRVFKVYPNPVSNELIIEIEGNNEKINFDILNAIGQIVYKGNVVDKTTVQTSDFAPGVYLIKLENGKTFELKKIIKE